MTERTTIMTPTMADRETITRWGAWLVSAGAAGIILAIVLYLTSGAVAPPGATVAEQAAALAEAPPGLAISAYLSIPADLALLVGAALLATRPLGAPGAALQRAAWSSIAVASLLVVQFDLLLPRGLMPLAADFAAAPAVFEALYRTSDYTHSVGLLVTFGSFIALFLDSARGTERVIPRGLAWVGVVAWSIGSLVAIGLVLERPIIVLAPSILLGWLLVVVLGVRTARATVRPRTHHAEQDHVEG